jgi:hypothetical protein
MLLARDDGTIELIGYEQKILVDAKPAGSVELKPLQDRTNEQSVKMQMLVAA